MSGLNPNSESERLVICIGDIHGYCTKLQNLWSNLQSQTNPSQFNNAIIIFLGDYCDRGPDSKRVLDFLISLPSKYPNQKHVFLAGNHDFAFAAFVGVLPPPPDGSEFREGWKEYAQSEEREGWYVGDGFENMHLQGRRWAGSIKVKFNTAKGTEYQGSIYDAAPTFESYGVSHGSAGVLRSRQVGVVVVFKPRQAPIGKTEWHDHHKGARSIGKTERHKGARSIGKTEEHDHPLTQSVFGLESSLPGCIRIRWTARLSTHMRHNMFFLTWTHTFTYQPFLHEIDLMKAVPDDHKKFLADLVWVHEEDNVCLETTEGLKKCRLIAVHGGLQQGNPVSEQLKRLKARDTAIPKVECLSGRKSIWDMPEELKVMPTILVSGHHGKLHIEGLRLIIDEGGGYVDKPVAAVILPYMKIVRDTDCA